MGYLNSVTLVGRLGNDIEVRTTGGGHSVCELRICTQWKDETEWSSCVAWRGDADIAEKFLKKGDMVCVQGRLQTRKWMGKDGAERSRTEIVVNRLVLIESKKKQDRSLSDFQPQVNVGGDVDAIPF